MIAPCKKCSKHGEDPACHSYCEGYLEFYEWNEKRKRTLQNEYNQYLIKENLVYWNGRGKKNKR